MNPRSLWPTGRSARSLHAWVLSCLLILGTLGDPIHRSQVAHAVCSEHGDIVHVAQPRSAADPAGMAAESSAKYGVRGPEIRGSDTAPAEDHDVCAFAAFAREAGMPAWNAPRPTPIIAGAAIPDARPERPAVAIIPRFLLAPKHSPPV